MTKINRTLVLLLLFVLVLAGSRWYFAPQQPEPSTIAQIRTATKEPTTVISPPTGEVAQEMVVPSGPIASIQPSDGAQLIPVEGAKTYTLGQGSTVTWIGRKIGGESQGTLVIRQGAVQVVDGIVVGGGIILDMESITTTDAEGTGLDELLKGDDFFAVSSHPTGSFIVQEVGGGQIVGVLTLKGISKQITFPGIVIVEDDSVVVTAQFAIDRKQRGITGGGPVVSEFIELSFTVRFVP